MRFRPLPKNDAEAMQAASNVPLQRASAASTIDMPPTD
jgi:hypothetical protein